MYLTTEKIYEKDADSAHSHYTRAWSTREAAEDHAKRKAQTTNGAPEFQVYMLISTTKTSGVYEAEVKLV